MTPRPSRFDPGVIAVAVDDLWPRIVEWSSDLADDEHGAKADLRGAFDSFDLDGYNIARRLERAGWGDVDAALVDVLEHGAVCISRARRDAVAAWVQREGITPAFEVGARVTSPRQQEGGVGIISRVDAAHAEYVVRFPLLGHVENGIGTHGSFLAFEDVEAAI